MTVAAPISRERLDRELVARGLTARALARAAGLSEVTVSKARNGAPIKSSTLRRLAVALSNFPVLPGHQLLDG